MYTIQPKKLLIINILDILRKYTDENHRLSQKEIVEILNSKYNMEVNRKTVKRNLITLIDFGYDIEYSETQRIIKDKYGNKSESTILSDFYLNRDFTNGELRLIIDSLIFSKHIPSKQCKELIEKVEGLSSVYFKSNLKNIKSMPNNCSENKQLFYTIEVLDEAISKNKQVSFIYNIYGPDKSYHYKETSSGEPKRYIINPYQMVASNGRHYLICNYDKYDKISYYRLDRISDIKILPDSRKPLNDVENGEESLHSTDYTYMFSGKEIRVEMLAKKYMVAELVDWFGNAIEFKNETDETVVATVTVNDLAIRKWALQYGLHIKILSPQSLVEEIKQDIKNVANNYDI